MRLFLTTGLLLALLGATGCSINTITPNANTSNITTSNPVSAVNLKAFQSLAVITPQLAKHRVVFVGEQHNQYSDHLNQLTIIKYLHKVWGGNTSIGLEMVQRPYQSYLDNYVAGKINEREMLKGVEWYQRWRYDFRLYRPIFAYARANKIPLIALNIPKELTMKITKVGIEGLNINERQQLPPFIDRTNDIYAKRITNVFARHSHTSSKGIAKFLDAQLAWDEGMAFSAAKYLKKNLKSRMVIIAGGGHVINRSGIPNRLDRQIKSTSAVVLNNINNTPSSKQGDYLLFSPDIELPATGKMGIVMTKGNGGVLVQGLSPHGAALKAGVQKGDLIIAIDGELIKSQDDILIWGLDKKPDDIAELKLRRNNKVLIRKVTLRKS